MSDENLPSIPQMSGNHRRVLSIRFRLLEEYCLSLMDLFQSSDTVFISRRALPSHQADEIGTGIRELRTLMAQVKTDLGLETWNEDGAPKPRALRAGSVRAPGGPWPDSRAET